MAKKITLKEVGEMLAHVVKHMATKDDLADLRVEMQNLEKRLTDRIDGVKVKVDGVQKAIDDRTLTRADENLPARVSRLEEKVFGAPRR